MRYGTMEGVYSGGICSFCAKMAIRKTWRCMEEEDSCSWSIGHVERRYPSDGFIQRMLHPTQCVLFHARLVRDSVQ